MPINYSPESAHAQEMAMWEMRPTREVTQDMIDSARRAGTHHAAFEFQEYPKAMYRAEQTANGIKITSDVSAASLVQEQNFKSRGYRVTQQEALESVEQSNQALAVADAERNYTDRRMSDKARAEAAAAEMATSKHVGAIPETPIRKRQAKETTHA